MDDHTVQTFIFLGWMIGSAFGLVFIATLLGAGDVIRAWHCGEDWRGTLAKHLKEF
uniref:hypothetical protein n=1 Tax=Marinobacterium profundum TaxID=1714300 RepID=UPI000B24010D|nr:hypothetical protein [Marinobacterium profundum]